MRRVLARRDMRLFLAGHTLSVFGDTALWLALGVWAKELTGSSAAAGMVFFFLAAPQLISPLCGMVVDRVRRRPLLIAANLATAAAVLPLLLVHDRGDVWILYAVTAAYGVSFTVLGAGGSALLATMLPVDELADANGVMQTAREGLRIVAPLAGAAMFAAFGGAVVALFDVATFVVAAALLARMRVAEPRPEPCAEPLRERVLAGIWHLRSTTPLRRLTGACAVALLVIGFSETLTYEIAGTGLHREPAFIGVLLAIQGIGAVAGSVAAAPLVRRVGEIGAAGLAMIVFSLGTTLLTSGTLAVVVAGKILFGFGIPVIVVALYTLLQRTTPGPLQGRTYSAIEVLVGTPQTLSIALGAAAVAFVDYRLLLLVEAAVVAAAGAWLLTRREQPVIAPH
ncbi:MAG TPA: MFS transporter [Solirubrobacteraceae bacterium]|nr:MFS transporter [Solirubrobacteraceae bacterium]